MAEGVTMPAVGTPVWRLARRALTAQGLTTLMHQFGDDHDLRPFQRRFL